MENDTPQITGVFDISSGASCESSACPPGTKIRIEGTNFSLRKSNVDVIFRIETTPSYAYVRGYVLSANLSEIVLYVPVYARDGSIKVIINGKNSDWVPFNTGISSGPPAQYWDDPDDAYLYEGADGEMFYSNRIIISFLPGVRKGMAKRMVEEAVSDAGYSWTVNECGFHLLTNTLCFEFDGISGPYSGGA